MTQRFEKGDQCLRELEQGYELHIEEAQTFIEKLLLKRQQLYDDITKNSLDDRKDDTHEDKLVSTYDSSVLKTRNMKSVSVKLRLLLAQEEARIEKRKTEPK
ncbi:hypothetical protein DPMN_062869 [Dreissena polymorpha]|uniref:Uncharacterized protein n=1 Tax=Dreissena polymorpha TaxID=45954 RepID=A0A9D4C9G3_DREPO|nr:hypothetical protein DPMN_062869 [Dreissena polymorpha]